LLNSVCWRILEYVHLK